MRKLRIDIFLMPIQSSEGLFVSEQVYIHKPLGPASIMSPHIVARGL